MEDKHNKQFGLRELPRDDRDYAVGRAFTLPELSELPGYFSTPVLAVKDQKDSDFCSAYASCAASEMQELLTLEPSFSFAMSKEITGDPEAWGQDLRSAMKAHVKYGGLPEAEDVPSIHKGDGASELRQPSYWEKLHRNLAKDHKKRSYFKVEGPYDAFDNIRATMWKFKDKDVRPIIGVEWSWSTNAVYIESATNRGFGHAICVLGWNGEFLEILNSYGEEAGNGGKHYIHRDVVNEFVPRFGAYAFFDIDKDEAKMINDYEMPEWLHWFARLINTLKHIIYDKR